MKINQKYLWKFGGVGVSVLGLTVLMASGYQKLVGGASPTEAILKASGVQGGINHEDQRKIQPDYFLPSRPENLYLGGYPIDQPAAATIDSGDTIRIDVISQSGNNSGAADPVTYWGQFGIKPEEVLQDAKDWWAIRTTKTNYGPHILTGPVYVRGAEPGDMIEIQILDLNPRVNYGINNTSANGGVFKSSYPGIRPGDPILDIPPAPPGAIAGIYPNVQQHVYHIGKDQGKDVALFSDTIHVPLNPFMGVMGVAPATGVFVGSTATSPPPATGVQSSTPPGPYGGNMDNKLLTIGSTLYLPVFQSGAQFFTGDSHLVQGDGEVSGTAIEHSLSGLFRFIVHKGKTIQWPRAENDDYYILMGIDFDLNRAMRIATLEAVKFLVEEKGLTQAKAFSLLSVGVDFTVSEVVDNTQVVSAKIPKALFIKEKKPKD